MVSWGFELSFCQVSMPGEIDLYYTSSFSPFNVSSLSYTLNIFGRHEDYDIT